MTILVNYLFTESHNDMRSWTLTFPWIFLFRIKSIRAWNSSVVHQIWYQEPKVSGIALITMLLIKQKVFGDIQNIILKIKVEAGHANMKFWECYAPGQLSSKVNALKPVLIFIWYPNNTPLIQVTEHRSIYNWWRHIKGIANDITYIWIHILWVIRPSIATSRQKTMGRLIQIPPREECS